MPILLFLRNKLPDCRDILIHDYLNVNLHRVWGIVEQDLPSLKQTVTEILQLFATLEQ
jgi:uncharacterized protein with HEPN domain